MAFARKKENGKFLFVSAKLRNKTNDETSLAYALFLNVTAHVIHYLYEGTPSDYPT